MCQTIDFARHFDIRAKKYKNDGKYVMKILILDATKFVEETDYNN